MFKGDVWASEPTHLKRMCFCKGQTIVALHTLTTLIPKPVTARYSDAAETLKRGAIMSAVIKK